MSRVLVVTTVHPPDDPRIRHKTVAGLARGFEVRYATRRPGPTGRTGMEWRALPGPRGVRWLLAGREMLRGDVDVISVHDPELLPLALLVSRLRGTPVVVDVHEDLLVRAALPRRPGRGRIRRGLRAIRARVAPVLARALLRAAERSCTITLAEAGYGRHFRQEHPVLANHVRPDLLPGPRPSAPGAPVVYVGDVTRPRGAVTLLDAVAAHLPDRPVAYVGRCRPELARTLRQRAAHAGVDLRLHGWLPYEQALAVAAGAAVGACPLLDHPSLRHSLPTKVLEYLASGVPVVASDLPGTTAVVAGLPGVALVPAGDVDALGIALAGALDPSVRAAAAAGGAEVRSRFSWDDESLLAVYRAAAAGHDHP